MTSGTRKVAGYILQESYKIQQMDSMGRKVMVDPIKVQDKELYPGEIARLAFISEIHPDTAVVYFEERDLYIAYRAKELLVILPKQDIFRNICRKFGKLGNEAVRQLLDVVGKYREKQYGSAFRIALGNKTITPLCLTDGTVFSKKGRQGEII